MTDHRPDSEFSDDTLRAYLAGDVDPAIRVRIDDRLHTDDAFQTRLRSLDGFGATLRGPSEALLKAAPQERLNAIFSDARNRSDEPRISASDVVEFSTPASRRRTPWPWVGLAMAASVAVGFYVGSVSERLPAPVETQVAEPASERPGWLVAVADYVSLFSPETFTAVPADAATKAASVAAVSDKLALDLSPAAADVPGLSFQRAEILDLNGKPLVQMAYLHESGIPVALCVLGRGAPAAADAAVPVTLTSDTVRDLNIVHWDVPGYGFLIIGDLPDDVLRALAEDLGGRLG